MGCSAKGNNLKTWIPYVASWHLYEICSVKVKLFTLKNLVSAVAGGGAPHGKQFLEVLYLPTKDNIPVRY